MAKGNGKAEIPAEIAQNPVILAMRITALEGALEKLTQVFQENMGHVRKAFNATDVHLWVLKSLAVDVAMGEDIPMTEEKNKETGEMEPAVNLAPYYEQFQKMQAASVEAAEAQDEPPPEEGEEFGGDEGDEQSQEHSNAEAGTGEGAGEEQRQGGSEEDRLSEVQGGDGEAGGG